jgi:Arc/MetJ-type ribon-helix-helix transcriptional regulator
MTIHLPEDLETSIRAEVDRGRFASVDDAMAEAVRSFLRQTSPEVAEPAANGHAETPAEHKPIWEEILEITAEIPDEAWDALPTDLSAQHDHYIYGTPKRPTS